MPAASPVPQACQPSGMLVCNRFLLAAPQIPPLLPLLPSSLFPRSAQGPGSGLQWTCRKNSPYKYTIPYEFLSHPRMPPLIWSLQPHVLPSEPGGACSLLMPSISIHQASAGLSSPPGFHFRDPKSCGAYQNSEIKIAGDPFTQKGHGAQEPQDRGQNLRTSGAISLSACKLSGVGVGSVNSPRPL